ncbi:MAG: hypothetical protein M3335_08640, partial [Actinomycetota bacterium]|nr:hypothetical protein [Actinomycetota bacterium]
MSESKSRPRPANARVGGGEIETTGSEKLLAFVLAVFIAIGAIWAYEKLDEVAKVDSTAYVSDQRLLGPAEYAALDEHRRAIRGIGQARSDRRAATRALELRREAYRTALDAGEPAAALRAEYEAA